MYVVEKLKLNRFVEVSIPKNCNFFARLAGARPVAPSGAYSGDETLPSASTKIDQLSAAAHAELQALRREAAEATNKAREADN